MLGKTTEYAIRALVYIHTRNREGKRPGFREVAQQIDAPVQFTAKVLQGLARADMICSVKGRGGGFFFDESAPPLSLFDVISAIEGEDFFTGCGFGLKGCDSTNPCPMHQEYYPVREEFHRLAKKQTIRSLAEKIHERAWLHIGKHWHAPSRQLAAPMSRCYRTDIGQKALKTESSVNSDQ